MAFYAEYCISVGKSAANYWKESGGCGANLLILQFTRVRTNNL